MSGDVFTAHDPQRAVGTHDPKLALVGPMGAQSAFKSRFEERPVIGMQQLNVILPLTRGRQIGKGAVVAIFTRFAQSRVRSRYHMQLLIANPRGGRPWKNLEAPAGE